MSNDTEAKVTETKVAEAEVSTEQSAEAKQPEAKQGLSKGAIVIAIIVAVALIAAAGVFGYRAYADAQLNNAMAACATASEDVRNATNDYNNLLNGDASDAAALTKDDVKDASTLDALNKAMGAEVPVYEAASPRIPMVIRLPPTSSPSRPTGTRPTPHPCRRPLTPSTPPRSDAFHRPLPSLISPL
ncbi:hypothetical protein BREU_0386 [Bifidobacterium reuteri DSM 23975]|uniref:Uncharacterized protein n=1 Tax=Bifidobacterium reuteri DSM 23975 TaxID=1437610 RepID=A0A087CYD3_9BIFI|nr:hypothetical protein [Bifidobacterium reuteri]KFI88283.1 hypothetical protein BREU_0386 [Bifidobacterium reuteri DSM 23975]